MTTPCDALRKRRATAIDEMIALEKAPFPPDKVKVEENAREARAKMREVLDLQDQLWALILQEARDRSDA